MKERKKNLRSYERNINFDHVNQIIQRIQPILHPVAFLLRPKAEYIADIIKPALLGAGY